MNTNLQFINCKLKGDAVHCQILERNDRLNAIGVDLLKYASCIFSFKDGLIQSFAAEIPPDFVKHNERILKSFIPWLSENHPNEYSRMFMPDGRFIYNLENGRDVVPLLREWGEEQKTER